MANKIIPKTLIEKAYENAETLINIDGYDFSRAIDTAAENFDLTEDQEHELYIMWYANNNNGIA